jgi:hypothetical protein
MFQLEMRRCGHSLHKDATAFLAQIQHLKPWHCALLVIYDDDNDSSVVTFSHRADNGLWLRSPICSRGGLPQDTLTSETVSNFNFEPLAYCGPTAASVRSALLCYNDGGEPFSGPVPPGMVSSMACYVRTGEAAFRHKLCFELRDEYIKARDDAKNSKLYKRSSEACKFKALRLAAFNHAVGVCVKYVAAA